jgi:hypothetical protein
MNVLRSSIEQHGLLETTRAVLINADFASTVGVAGDFPSCLVASFDDVGADNALDETQRAATQKYRKAGCDSPEVARNASPTSAFCSSSDDA